jgi:ATP-dependent DNA helicase RecQ
VYRTGQRFGVNYVIDVLMGNERDRILQNRHHELSTFGIGDLDANEWRSLFRQLIALGYVTADIDNYGALKLNASCKPILSGSETLRLRRFVKRRKAARSASADSRQKAALTAGDMPLFEALRLHRSELAQQQSVPPYVIFHDKTLVAICELRPQDTEQLAEIPGIGTRKLEQYGDGVIRIVREFPRQAAAAEEAVEPG